MKIWLAYRFTGADKFRLRQDLQTLRSSFAAFGLEMFTMIEDIQAWDPDCMPKADAIRRACELMRACEGCICLYDGKEASEGRGWEAGFFAGLGKPTAIALAKPLSLPYVEALFTTNPANNKRSNPWPGVIRYFFLSEIAPDFVMQKEFICSAK